MGFVKDCNVRAAAALPDVDGKEKELEQDWDTIVLDT
jgi:hypothetical protein